MKSIVLAVVLAACGGSSTPPTDPSAVAKPAADPAPCEDAAANAVTFLSKDAPADKVKVVITKHCTAEAWTVDTRKCLLTAKSVEEIEACAKSFTPEQQTALRHDVETLDAGSGAPATPPANTPPSNIPPPAGSMPTR